jgi:hypothetical protein
MGHWILQTNGKIKSECLLVFVSSGGIVVVGSGSTRVIDRVLKIIHFRSRGMKDVVTRSRELRTHDS